MLMRCSQGVGNDCPDHKLCINGTESDCPDHKLCINGTERDCYDGAKCFEGIASDCASGNYCKDGESYNCPNNTVSLERSKSSTDCIANSTNDGFIDNVWGFVSTVFQIDLDSKSTTWDSSLQTGAVIGAVFLIFIGVPVLTCILCRRSQPQVLVENAPGVVNSSLLSEYKIIP